MGKLIISAMLLLALSANAAMAQNATDEEICAFTKGVFVADIIDMNANISIHNGTTLQIDAFIAPEPKSYLVYDIGDRLHLLYDIADIVFNAYPDQIFNADISVYHPKSDGLVLGYSYIISPNNPALGNLKL